MGKCSDLRMSECANLRMRKYANLRMGKCADEFNVRICETEGNVHF